MGIYNSFSFCNDDVINAMGYDTLGTHYSGGSTIFHLERHSMPLEKALEIETPLNLDMKRYNKAMNFLVDEWKDGYTSIGLAITGIVEMGLYRGLDIPKSHCKKAVDDLNDERSDREGMKEWSDPPLREQRIAEEISFIKNECKI